MDYLRLFDYQVDAERAAFHSAAAWSRHHTGEESVRTLLLSSSQSGKDGSSYAFIAHGCLFWVRRLVGSTNAPNLPVSHAHVVVTEGVIGGTGNRNSRRGLEAPTGRVYFGTEEAARLMATRACQELVAHLPQGCHSEVRTVPIGKPLEYASLNFLRDWPPQVLNVGNNMTTNSNKRQQHHCVESHLVDLEGSEVVDCPFSSSNLPPTKRRKFSDHDSEYWQLQDAVTVSEDEMQTS